MDHPHSHIARRLCFVAVGLSLVASSGFAQKKGAKKNPVGTVQVNGPTTLSGSTSGIFQTKKLANGLELVVVENHMVPIATVVYVAKNGSYTEPDEFAGLSHLYEHMFFKKNRVIPNEEAFNEKNRELGMTNNASTAEEVVEYHFTMPAANLEKGIEFMSNAIMAPAFDPKDVEQEREVVLGEFDRNEASPYFPLSRAMDSAMWDGLVARKQPLGQRPVIKGATQAKMFAIQQKFYIPNNSALLISGDVKAADVYKYAEKYLGKWASGTNPFPTYTPPAFPPIQKQLIVREAVGVPTVAVNIGWHGPSIGKDNASTYAADVFSTIVNNATSKLYKNLVDQGLALGVGISYYTQQNVGPIQISMAALPQKAKPAIAALWNEVKHWTDADYFTDEELNNAKEQLAIQRLYEQENPTNFIMSSVPFAWAVTGLDYYNNYLTNLRAVTRADINRYLNTYVVGKPYAMGIAANKMAIDKLQFKPEEVMQ